MVPAVWYASATLQNCSFLFSSTYIALVLEALSLGDSLPLFKHISAFGYLMLSPYPFPLFAWNGSQLAAEILTELKNVTHSCLSGEGKWFGIQAVDKTHVFMRKHALSYFLSFF